MVLEFGGVAGDDGDGADGGADGAGCADGAGGAHGVDGTCNADGGVGVVGGGGAAADGTDGAACVLSDWSAAYVLGVSVQPVCCVFECSPGAVWFEHILCTE